LVLWAWGRPNLNWANLKCFLWLSTKDFFFFVIEKFMELRRPWLIYLKTVQKTPQKIDISFVHFIWTSFLAHCFKLKFNYIQDRQFLMKTTNKIFKFWHMFNAFLLWFPNIDLLGFEPNMKVQDSINLSKKKYWIKFLLLNYAKKCTPHKFVGKTILDEINK